MYLILCCLRLYDFPIKFVAVDAVDHFLAESSEAISSIPQNEAKTTSTSKDGVKTEEE